MFRVKQSKMTADDYNPEDEDPVIWHSEDHASLNILIMKANEMHYFSDLFDKVLYMFRTGPLSETCRVLYQINLRNSASRWLSL